MTLSRIKKIVNDGGATLNKSGKSVSFENGYQVSFRDCFILDAENVEQICDAVNGLLKSCRASDFVGVWIDSGKAYIDLSERIENKVDALRVGRERKQLSIFEWATGECIACNA